VLARIGGPMRSCSAWGFRTLCIGAERVPSDMPAVVELIRSVLQALGAAPLAPSASWGGTPLSRVGVGVPAR